MCSPQWESRSPVSTRLASFWKQSLCLHDRFLAFTLLLSLGLPPLGKLSPMKRMQRFRFWRRHSLSDKGPKSTFPWAWLREIFPWQLHPWYSCGTANTASPDPSLPSRPATASWAPCLTAKTRCQRDSTDLQTLSLLKTTQALACTFFFSHHSSRSPGKDSVNANRETEP